LNKYVSSGTVACQDQHNVNYTFEPQKVEKPSYEEYLAVQLMYLNDEANEYPL